jgi:hypothetical protein
MLSKRIEIYPDIFVVPLDSSQYPYKCIPFLYRSNLCLLGTKKLKYLGGMHGISPLVLQKTADQFIDFILYIDDEIDPKDI